MYAGDFSCKIKLFVERKIDKNLFFNIESKKIAYLSITY